MQKTSNLDGLDLELSQNTRAFDATPLKANITGKEEEKKVDKAHELIKKNELLDSLDLNVGMDALMKLQAQWGQSNKAKPAASAR